MTQKKPRRDLGNRALKPVLSLSGKDLKDSPNHALPPSSNAGNGDKPAAIERRFSRAEPVWRKQSTATFLDEVSLRARLKERRETSTWLPNHREGVSGPTL